MARQRRYGEDLTYSEWHRNTLPIAPRIERPPEVQARINELNIEIRSLEAQHPITYFTVRRLWPHPTKLERLTPEEFAAEIYLLHRDHHQHCLKAQRDDPVYKVAEINAARARSYVWVPRQERLTFTEEP